MSRKTAPGDEDDSAQGVAPGASVSDAGEAVRTQHHPRRRVGHHRRHPGHRRRRADLPTTVGGVAVTRIDDLLTGVDDLPPGDVLRLWLDGGSRLIVRPSGTEPKLELYLDVRGSSAKKACRRLEALRAGAEEMLAAVR